jgi:hypothetical protein
LASSSNRVVDAHGPVRLEDGSEVEVDAVIWATGMQRLLVDQLPIFGEDGRLRHRRGVTDLPGLFLGLTWQHTRLGADRLGAG